MAASKVIPIVVEDYMPFLCLYFGKDTKDMKLHVFEQFPLLKHLGNLEILPALDIKEGQSIIIDPEMFIIECDEELRSWLGEYNGYYSGEVIDNDSGLFDEGFPEEESENKDVKLLTGPNTGSNTEEEKSTNKSDTDSDKQSEEESTEVKDVTLWV